MTASAAECQIVTRNAPLPQHQVVTQPVQGSATHPVSVVTRQIVEPAAVVDRALAQQPVYAHLIEVRVNHSTIYLDPQVDYLRQNGRTMTEPNYLTAAIQYHNTHAHPQAMIVRNEAHHRPAVALGHAIEPRMIILRPDYLERRHQQEDAEPDATEPKLPRVLAPIPKVRSMPTPAAEHGSKMVMAD